MQRGQSVEETSHPRLASVGFVLCLLREWRGTLLAPMAAHALNNGVILTLMVLLMM